MAQTVIPNGVQAIEFRNRVVDNYMADQKGSIFVGTGTPGTANSMIVETINPVDNIVSGLQPNTIKLPIYTGAGDSGMVFVNAPNVVIGRAETLGTSAAACAVGGAGTPVYFSGGKPVACTNSSIQVGHATNAAKLDGGAKGNASTPIYIKSDGTPAACTNSSITAGYASQLNPAVAVITNLSGAAAIPTNIGTGLLFLLFKVTETSGINDSYGTALIYNHGGAQDCRTVSELPFTNLQSSFSIWVRFKTYQGQLYWEVTASPGYSFSLSYLQIIKICGLWL